MKCEEVELKMLDYLDNNIDDTSRLEIERHIETCESCLDLLRDNQRVLNLISNEEMASPDDSLRINFYHMLHSQINKEEKNHISAGYRTITPWYYLTRYRVAAGVALLLCGTFLGMIIRTEFAGTASTSELKQLHSEVLDLKKAAMFTMLKDQSSSDRIQAVGYADEISDPDQNVIEVLVNTLNHDKNVNVRMAAAYALSKYAGEKAVSDSLVSSLSLQTDPILQVTLINILAERKVKSAFRPIQEIISNKRTLKEVRAVAENSLRVLM